MKKSTVFKIIVKPTPEKPKKNPRSLEKWQQRNEFLEKFKQHIDSIKDENSPTKFKENYKLWSEWLRDGDSKTRSSYI